MYQKYIEECVEKAERPISDIISRAGLYTFNNRPPANPTDKKACTMSTQSQVALTTQMYMSVKARPDSDLNDFFKHENVREPPMLSAGGKLYQGTMSDLIDCIPGMPKPGRNARTKDITALLYDMPSLVHLIGPKAAKNFEEYPELQLQPYMVSQLTTNKSCTRIDNVWDVYKRFSLKNQIREARSSA